ncbi:MarR family transcriptional regulator [Cryobacterium sp. GrIS_2_6]|uniref:MarR family winged helix-turn-helix transcriptional regulator n=1 Tax=Cryobacterium sp. GrIS_2_6 TaxID=3162785 RepID=UPI002DFDF0BA|nr:MarR family transcriptional regulator [Cryobacterium psychrotolerans]MEC5150537.1 DNA-binding MarR family transcriptional regulator [Cryobacterium psychrotolerans]
MSRELNGLIRSLRIELGILNDRIAETVGLNARDLDILDVIDRDGPCTPKYLASRTGVRAATLTGMLSRLEADRWITRSRDSEDGRSAQLSSTARFTELHAGYAAADEQVRKLAASLDPAMREAIAAFLAEVGDVARMASDDLSLRSRENRS